MHKIRCLVLLAICSVLAAGQTPGGGLGFPADLKSPHWRNEPAAWSMKDGVLTMKAAGKTDWYIEPTGEHRVASSPLMLMPAGKDFWFSAKVTVDFKSWADAGALVVYADEENWVKFAFESPNGKTGAIVSVVTRGLSDDNTGAMIESNSVYLKVSKVGQAMFLYYSADGKKWNLTRAFNLGPEQPLQYGFSAQSPSGAGSTVTFSEIQYKAEALKPWTGE